MVSPGRPMTRLTRRMPSCGEKNTTMSARCDLGCPFKQLHVWTFGKDARVDFKVFVELQKELRAAAGHAALRFAFGTLAKGAEPATVAVRRKGRSVIRRIFSGRWYQMLQ